MGEALGYVMTMDPVLLLYLGAIAAPFFQEDAAVIGSAYIASTGQAEPPLMFASLMTGLVVSDGWKYWAGRLAGSHAWARKWAEKPGVAAAKEQVVKRLGVSLLIARFVPGTRIPLYLASGLFGAPFLRFIAYVIFSGLLYAGLAFTVMHYFGKAAAENALLAGAAAVALLAALAGLYLWARSRARARAPGG